MSRMKIEPGGTVRSLEELAAIATALEDQAAAAYAQIAQRLAGQGSAPVMQVLERLAGEHRQRRGAAHRAGASGIGAGAATPDPGWRPDGAFDDEGLATASPQLLTSYRVLSTAARNEERAFALWTYMAAHAPDSPVRQAAEALACKRLDDAARRRSERRAAYHAERRAGHRDLGPSPTGSAPGDAHLSAAELRLLRKIEATPREPGEDLLKMEFVSLGRHHIEMLRLGAIGMGRAPAIGPPAHANAVSLAEFLAQSYLDAAQANRDEEGLRLAQELAEGAVQRLAWLRARPEVGQA